MSARCGVDVGGTFTDVILHGADGSVRVHKLLSTPPSYDEAVVDAVSGLAAAEGAERVAEVVHGTTVATNAVLQRLGAETALLTTAGFRDVLELRRLRVPHMYDLFWRKPPPLVARRLRFEVPERLAADGTVVVPLDEDAVRAIAARLRVLGVDSVAVCFLHSYLYPGHERRTGAILAEELPGATVSLSSEILREQREYERSATTVVNAYVRPLMASYIDRIRTGLDRVGLDSAPLAIMQSSGGVMTSEDAKVRPVFALESGPAAGVVAALGMVQRLGVANAIAFDMGGTTAKASLIEAGAIARGREYEAGGSISAGSRLIRGAGELLRIPTIDIAEVGAGGGSIAWLDAAGGLQVGPRSAGAAPGPACYGRGGVEPTVTDANVVLGLMPAGQVADGQITIRRELAEAAIERVAAPLGLGLHEAADGIHRIANARMTRALRSVSSEKGRDPRDFALIAYGGSGPVHASGLADDLGVRTILVPPVAGLFSAVGLLFARPEFHEVRPCHLDVDTVDPAVVAALLDELESALRTAFAGREAPTWARSADLRYGGQSWEIEVELPPGPVDRALLAAVRERFEDEHEVLYGVRGQPGSPVQVRAVRLAALGESSATPSFEVADALVPDRHATRRVWLAGQTVEVPVRARSSFGAEPVGGPAPRRRVRHDRRRRPGLGRAPRRGHRDARPRAGGLPMSTPPQPSTDPVTLQIVANALQSITDEMATTITRTAHSTVVRDGMDFSGRALQRQGRDRGPGGQRPVPPGVDPDRDRVAARPVRGAAPARRRLRDERPLRRRDAPAGRVRRQARAPGRGAARLRRDDGAPRRRRRPAARLERVRQHRDLPGRAADAVAAPVRGGRAGRGGAPADRGQRADPEDDLRRPRRPGRGVLRRRACAPGARGPPRRRGARRADGGADRLHRAPRPPRDRVLAGRHGDVHGLARLGRRRGARRRDHRDDHDPRRRGRSPT